jgi:hypothetical protein
MGVWEYGSMGVWEYGNEKINRSTANKYAKHIKYFNDQTSAFCLQ